MASGRSLELRKIKPAAPKMVLKAPRKAENRHDRRKAEAMAGKKNTRGFPLGYNAVTWARANAEGGSK